MGRTILALTLAAALLAPGCASSRNSSEREWQRAQCDRIIDRDARDKCLERVDQEYGRR